MEKLDQKMDLVLGKLDSLTKSVDFLAKKYEELKDNVKGTIENQEKVNKAVCKVQKENKELKKEMANIKMKVEILERTALEQTLNLYPLLETNGENLRDILGKIGDAVGFKNLNKNVVMVYRRPQKKSGKPGDILIKCDSVYNRNLLLEKIKAKKLAHKDIGLICSLDRIYGNEELTWEAKNVYYSAVKSRREKGWKYLWVKAGRTYVKKEDGGATFRLDNMDELEKIR